jgi:broad specificity phosphatase PhoE
MEIYLVRHGQTGGNVAHRHQAEHTPLTKLGEQQAVAVAEEIKTLRPTHIVTSNLIRTIETTRYISEACNLIPETNHNLVELKRPVHIYGQHHRSFKSLWFYVLWYLGRDTVLEDKGESYRALRERIKVVQDTLATYPEDARVVVVTHSVFIGMFLAHLCDKKPLTPFGALFAFKRILTMPNVNVYKVKHNRGDNDKTCAWSLEN